MWITILAVGLLYALFAGTENECDEKKKTTTETKKIKKNAAAHDCMSHSNLCLKRGY